METAGKPQSADENIRRLRKLQQDAQLAFREQITRHRDEVVARQNDFRENFPPPMAEPARPAPENHPDEITGPEQATELPAPAENDEALADPAFPEEAQELPVSLEPEDALPQAALPDEATGQPEIIPPETVRAPSRVERDRLARRRSRRLQARRAPPPAQRRRDMAEPDSKYQTSVKESAAPPPSEPEEELSVEDQKVLNEIEIFETLWQKKDARETPPPSPPSSSPPSQTDKKPRSFFGGLFDMSPLFRDVRNDDGNERF